MYSHADDFIPFLPSTSGEDGPGALSAGIISPKQFEYYCQAIRDTSEWGGEPEILALSRAFNVPIHVIQSGKPPIVIHNPTGTPNDGDIRDKRVVRISYHRRMYGLGEVSTHAVYHRDALTFHLVALQFTPTPIKNLEHISIHSEYLRIVTDIESLHLIILPQ